MGTMNISLSDGLREFVDERVVEGGYSTSSEYVRELIRKDRDLQRLRKLLLDGANSGLGEPLDESHFSDLRARARRSAAE